MANGAVHCHAASSCCECPEGTWHVAGKPGHILAQGAGGLTLVLLILQDIGSEDPERETKHKEGQRN